MERLGILEMDELRQYGRKVTPAELDVISDKQLAFLTLLQNEFSMIPEGFTGVYMRDDECQIVPNDLLPSIKLLSVRGFEHIPEDHELHLFSDRLTQEGQALNTQIIEAVMAWMDKNL